ncbi:non-ribosomal peptide synthetase [Vibrio proteolyticus]
MSTRNHFVTNSFSDSLDKVENWRSLASNFSVSNQSHYDGHLSSKVFSLSSESASILISVANGSDKRLSMLLATLTACAKASIFYCNNNSLLTSNYIEDEEEPKIVCLPFHYDPIKTLKELVVIASVTMRDQVKIGVKSIQDVCNHPVQFPLAVALKGCQHLPSDLYKQSLTQVIFARDGEHLSCEVSSYLGHDYIHALVSLVEHWTKQIRSSCTVSELEIYEPFVFNSDVDITATESNASIIEVFQEQVNNHAEQIAVVCPDSHISYFELDKLSTIMAKKLSTAGVEKGDSVGIHMSRSTRTIVAMLAVLKAGGRYCPFDTNWPLSRKEYVQDTADIRMIIDEKQTPLNLAHSEHVNYEDLLLDDGAEDNTQLPNVGGNDSAYIIFTSGSTGNPKGVEVDHSAVNNLVLGLEHKVYQHYPIPLNVSVISSWSFDASIQQMYPALLLGHTLHIVPENVRKDGKKIVQFWRDNEIHIADCTPTHMRMIRLQMDNQHIDCPVMHMMIGGERLEVNNWRSFSKSWCSPPNASNAYGPTECCVQSLSYEFKASTSIKGSTVPIGTPMLGEEIVLLDKAQRILPRGAIGEIAISGKGVFKGYINNIDLTEASFVFIEGKQYYRTGDLARYIGNEGLEFLGRIDNQVKINGYRIELGEVEAAIQKVLRMKDSHQGEIGLAFDVYVMMSKGDSPILIAYICSDETFDSQSLRSDVAACLPDYMVPSYFISVPEFPQNSSGKIDRTKLPDPKHDILNKNNSVDKSKTEQKVSQLWSEILKTRVENIKLDDSFFDLGGGSFELAQLSIRLTQLFSTEVEAVDLFKYTTIKSQANYIDNGKIIKESSCDIDRSVEMFDDTIKMFGH